MKKLLRSFAYASMVAMLGTFAVACGDDDDDPVDPNALTENEQEMKSAVEQYVSGVVYSIYGDLANETQTLFEALQTVQEAGVENLTDAQLHNICTIFLQARQSYEESEAFLYGAATDFGIDPHIDTWPLDLDGLATALGNTEQFANLVDEDGHVGDDQIAYAAGKLGQELLGFHGIEFIIFRNGAERTAADLQANETDPAFTGKTVTGTQELAYATAVAGDLRDRCWQMYVAWDPDAPANMKQRVEDIELPTTVGSGSKSYGENMLDATKAGSTYATWQEAVNTILIAGCSNICNEVANVKMGNAHSGEDVNYIESPYSKKSFTDYRDNIYSIQYSLYGASLATSPNSNSIMAFLQKHNSSMATSLQSALDAAISSINTAEAKGAFVDIYADPVVQDAMDAVNALDSQLNTAAAWIVLQ